MLYTPEHVYEKMIKPPDKHTFLWVHDDMGEDLKSQIEEV